MLLPGKSHNSLRWFYIFIVVAIGLIGIASAIFVGYAVNSSNKAHLIDRSNTLAQLITSEDLHQLLGTEADLENPAYQRFKQRLMAIKNVNADVRFIYITGIHDDGTIFFYGDSEDPRSPDYSPPGQLYTEASPLMHQIYVTKKSSFEAARDRWGYWVSSYAPIIDPDSLAVLGFIGIDMPGQRYIVDVIAYSSLPLIFSMIIISLILISFYVQNRKQRVVEQKVEFLSVASHEIRSPLTGIRWASENLLTSPTLQLAEYPKKIVGMIHDSCINLIERINDLLTVTKFESGKDVKLTFESKLILPLIQDLVKTFDLAASSRGVKIIIDPSLNAEATIYADTEQIRYVYTNIVSNAIKYTKPDTEIKISYSRQNNQDRVSFTDHGGGLTADEIAHIFDGYHRTRGAQQSVQYGTGLGLYLAKKIVNMHHGQIVVDSKVHEGTAFTIALPTQK